jgi:predicted aspartyl protease
MRCELEVNDIMVDVIIDTGAAINVMSNKLRKILNAPIEQKSNFRCIMANGQKVASLGKTTLNIGINEDIILPIEVDVIDSIGKDLIIGNETLKDINAHIDFENKILEIEDNEGTIIEIPVEYEITSKKIENDKNFEDEIETSDEGEVEYESDEEKQLFTIKDIEDYLK